jgi:hypothetical protein
MDFYIWIHLWSHTRNRNFILMETIMENKKKIFIYGLVAFAVGFALAGLRSYL